MPSLTVTGSNSNVTSISCTSSNSTVSSSRFSPILPSWSTLSLLSSSPSSWVQVYSLITKAPSLTSLSTFATLNSILCTVLPYLRYFPFFLVTGGIIYLALAFPFLAPALFLVQFHLLRFYVHRLNTQENSSSDGSLFSPRSAYTNYSIPEESSEMHYSNSSTLPPSLVLSSSISGSSFLSSSTSINRFQPAPYSIPIDNSPIIPPAYLPVRTQSEPSALFLPNHSPCLSSLDPTVTISSSSPPSPTRSLSFIPRSRAPSFHLSSHRPSPLFLQRSHTTTTASSEGSKVISSGEEEQLSGEGAAALSFDVVIDILRKSNSSSNLDTVDAPEKYEEDQLAEETGLNDNMMMEKDNRIRVMEKKSLSLPSSSSISNSGFLSTASTVSTPLTSASSRSSLASSPSLSSSMYSFSSSASFGESSIFLQRQDQSRGTSSPASSTLTPSTPLSSSSSLSNNSQFWSATETSSLPSSLVPSPHSFGWRMSQSQSQLELNRPTLYITSQV